RDVSPTSLLRDGQGWFVHSGSCRSPSPVWHTRSSNPDPSNSRISAGSTRFVRHDHLLFHLRCSYLHWIERGGPLYLQEARVTQQPDFADARLSITACSVSVVNGTDTRAHRRPSSSGSNSRRGRRSVRLTCLLFGGA